MLVSVETPFGCMHDLSRRGCDVASVGSGRRRALGNSLFPAPAFQPGPQMGKGASSFLTPAHPSLLSNNTESTFHFESPSLDTLDTAFAPNCWCNTSPPDERLLQPLLPAPGNPTAASPPIPWPPRSPSRRKPPSRSITYIAPGKCSTTRFQIQSLRPRWLPPWSLGSPLADTPPARELARTPLGPQSRRRNSSPAPVPPTNLPAGGQRSGGGVKGADFHPLPVFFPGSRRRKNGGNWGFYRFSLRFYDLPTEALGDLLNGVRADGNTGQLPDQLGSLLKGQLDAHQGQSVDQAGAEVAGTESQFLIQWNGPVMAGRAQVKLLLPVG